MKKQIIINSHKSAYVLTGIVGIVSKGSEVSLQKLINVLEDESISEEIKMCSLVVITDDMDTRNESEEKILTDILQKHEDLAVKIMDMEYEEDDDKYGRKLKKKNEELLNNSDLEDMRYIKESKPHKVNKNRKKPSRKITTYPFFHLIEKTLNGWAEVDVVSQYKQVWIRKDNILCQIPYGSIINYDITGFEDGINEQLEHYTRYDHYKDVVDNINELRVKIVSEVRKVKINGFLSE